MKKWLMMVTMILGSLFLFSACILPSAEQPYTPSNEYELGRIEMIERVEKSVVIVKTDSGHGSGVVYKKEAIEGTSQFRYSILTNYHVIEDGGEIMIKYGRDGLQVPVRSFASYPSYDIAVLRIETEEMLDYIDIAPISQPGTTIQIKRGQDVYAIGTPEELLKYNYVTSGIVSLTSYPYRGVTDLAIMHNAEVNPGNSGGPLFNYLGEVIGINVAKVPDVTSQFETIAAEGLNYALNMNIIAVAVNNFKEEDFTIIERIPRLGVTVRNLTDHRDLEINPDYDASLYPEDQVDGVVVIDFDLTRNGYKVLKLNDVIVEMNGKVVKEIPDISAELVGARMGDEHTVKVLRKVSGKFIAIIIKIILS